MKKEKLRKEFLEKREKLLEKEVLEKSKKITERVYKLEDYKYSETIFTYLSFNNEVSTNELVNKSLQTKKILVPIMEGGDIYASELCSIEETKKNKYGIREPVEPKKINPKKIDIVFIPGIVFDKRCNRIGFGYGYFDKILKKMEKRIPTYALSFDFQVQESIPKEEHDVPLDYIITEKKIYGGENEY